MGQRRNPGAQTVDVPVIGSFRADPVAQQNGPRIAKAVQVRMVAFRSGGKVRIRCGGAAHPTKWEHAVRGSNAEGPVI